MMSFLGENSKNADSKPDILLQSMNDYVINDTQQKTQITNWGITKDVGIPLCTALKVLLSRALSR